jgi:hypothetical protein
LSGEGIHREEDKGSGECLRDALAMGKRGDGMAFDVSAKLEEDEKGSDS